MPKIVLIGGGSASGKTFVTRKVIEMLGVDKVTHLSIDDYYKDLTDLPMEERAKINYDHPKAFDWKLLRSQLADLKAGKTIEKPVYDFTVHNRSQKTESVSPKDIIIVEGIMALVDDKVRHLSDLNVFINASRERRFLRRLIRDHNERGRTYESIIEQYFATVQPMFEEVIASSMNYADVLLANDGVSNKAINVLTQILTDLINNK